MNFSNYQRKEVIIDSHELTRFAIIFLITVVVVFLIPFYFIWGKTALAEGFNLFLRYILLFLIPIVIIHEGLHGLVWSIFASTGFRSIKFGFNVALLSPYTHCKEPLKKWFYFFGGIAPLVFTGIIPAVYAVSAGSGFWLLIAAFCTWSSAGDILSCLHILKIKKEVFILDHPDTLGFFVFTRSDSSYL